MVGAGLDRLCAVLFGFGSSLPDARASRGHRALRIGGSSVELPLVAALSGFVVRRGTARRRWALPTGGQMGLVRRRGSQSDASSAETSQMGKHGFLLSPRTHDASGLHEDRPRAPRSGRRALRSVLGRAGYATLGEEEKIRSTKSEIRN